MRHRRALQQCGRCILIRYDILAVAHGSNPFSEIGQEAFYGQGHIWYAGLYTFNVWLSHSCGQFIYSIMLYSYTQ